MAIGDIITTITGGVTAPSACSPSRRGAGGITTITITSL
jgi:hypothetical protein